MIRFIIPAFNEEKNIETLLGNTRKYAESLNATYEIIIVNDGSVDGTMSILNKHLKTIPLVVLDQVTNKGAGLAFKRGFDYVASVADDSDIIVTKEADNTSDLGVLATMIEKLRSGYDIVLASCYMPGGGVEGTNAYRHFLSAGANLLMKLFTPLKGIHTFSSFYRVYRAGIIKKVLATYGDAFIEEKGFACMVEMLIKFAEANARIAEVPMVLKGGKRQGKSKMKVGRTIAAYLRLIIKGFARRMSRTSCN